ncbi:tRNA 2-thiouridine(34) synthase MnmA [Patescibacteria group bacterium]|nr:tRNA 2-thiouridine(34) synthase MnmA [Patescibacteria group bacterium]
MKKKKRILVAMSGGVDSSVAAALLKNGGYDVAGIFLDLGQFNLKESLKGAKKTAEKIGIPLKILDLRKQFKKEVIDYFIKGYENGITPNPCVKCNKQIKFGLLLKLMKKWKYDCLSAGHYIRLQRNLKSQISNLKMAKDKTKDQSYFLYNLKKGQLGKLLFPLGNYTKEKIKKMADGRKLPYLKKESQDICFLTGGHNDYLKKNIKLKKGKIITVDGKIIGEHQGLPLYTIGQRHGFSKGGGIPYYVVSKNLKKNFLIVASKIDEEKYYKKEIKIRNINWISGNPPAGGKIYKARIRYRQGLQSCRIKGTKVIFTKPQRAVTPGQSLVIYKGQELIGGGIII